MGKRGQRGPRRRNPGHATLEEVNAALAPFNRPLARTPFDMPGSFVIRELGSGDTRHGELEFTLTARATLLRHFGFDGEQGDVVLEQLADGLKLVFVEENGYARRHTYHQLLAALRTLARLDPELPLPALPPAFLRAVISSERRRRAGKLMRDGSQPRPQDLAHDVELACEAWQSLQSAAELASLADDLFRAVRNRRATNWEELARRAQWDTLREGAIDVVARLWCEQLLRPARASKEAVGLAIDLLRLVDPTFPADADAYLFDNVRKLLTRAMRRYQPSGCGAAIPPSGGFRVSR